MKLRSGHFFKHTLRRCLMRQRIQNSRIQRGLYTVKIRLLSTIFLKSVNSFHPNSHHHLPENSSKLSARSLSMELQKRKKGDCNHSSDSRASRGRWRACTLGLCRFGSSLLGACAEDPAQGPEQAPAGVQQPKAPRGI